MYKLRQAIVLLSCFVLLGCAVAPETVASVQNLNAEANIEVAKYDGVALVRYSLRLKNRSDHALCISEYTMPEGDSYVGQGMAITGPSSADIMESRDTINAPSLEDYQRSYHAVLVMLPAEETDYSYVLSKYFDFSTPGTYTMRHSVYYTACSNLDGFSSLSPSSKDWKQFGHMIEVESKATVPIAQ